MKDGRIPTWGLLLMIAASLIGLFLMTRQLLTRYRKRWPW